MRVMHLIRDIATKLTFAEKQEFEYKSKVCLLTLKRCHAGSLTARGWAAIKEIVVVIVVRDKL